MKNYKITSTGLFMTILLARDNFDSFLMQDAKITTALSYTIDGRIHKDFYDTAEREDITNEFIAWSEVKKVCHELIKGKRTPLSFNINLMTDKTLTERIINEASTAITPGNVDSMNLFIRYDGQTVSIVTSVSLNIFTLDKSLEEYFDKWVNGFLTGNAIEFEV